MPRGPPVSSPAVESLELTLLCICSQARGSCCSQRRPQFLRVGAPAASAPVRGSPVLTLRFTEEATRGSPYSPTPGGNPSSEAADLPQDRPQAAGGMSSAFTRRKTQWLMGISMATAFVRRLARPAQGGWPLRTPACLPAVVLFSLTGGQGNQRLWESAAPTKLSSLNCSEIQLRLGSTTWANQVPSQPLTPVGINCSLLKSNTEHLHLA